MAYAYSIQCCTPAWIDIFTDRISECRGCGSTFEISDSPEVLALQDVPLERRARHESGQQADPGPGYEPRHLNRT